MASVGWRLGPRQFWSKIGPGPRCRAAGPGFRRSGCSGRSPCWEIAWGGTSIGMGSDVRRREPSNPTPSITSRSVVSGAESVQPQLPFRQPLAWNGPETRSPGWSDSGTQAIRRVDSLGFVPQSSLRPPRNPDGAQRNPGAASARQYINGLPRRLGFRRAPSATKGSSGGYLPSLASVGASADVLALGGHFLLLLSNASLASANRIVRATPGKI